MEGQPVEAPATVTPPSTAEHKHGRTQAWPNTSMAKHKYGRIQAQPFGAARPLETAAHKLASWGTATTPEGGGLTYWDRARDGWGVQGCMYTARPPSSAPCPSASVSGTPQRRSRFQVSNSVPHEFYYRSVNPIFGDENNPLDRSPGIRGMLMAGDS